jgi:hypothetical protein
MELRKSSLVDVAGIALLTVSTAAACGSSSKAKSASSAAAAQPSASASVSAPVSAPSSPTPTPAAASADTLTVTGAVSLTLSENTTITARRCDPGATAAAPITGMIPFGSGDKQYVLQLVSLPEGTSTLPGAKAAVAFYNGTVSAEEWGAGLTQAAGSGTATLSADGKKGTVDLMMTQAAPSGSPAKAPIHLSGTFSC